MKGGVQMGTNRYSGLHRFRVLFDVDGRGALSRYITVVLVFDVLGPPHLAKHGTPFLVSRFGKQRTRQG